MILYYYCSYDGSPVGFQIGFIDTSHTEDGLQKIPEQNYKKGIFIANCLECGLIQSGFGVVPQKDEEKEHLYFIIKKKLLFKENEKKYYINIAFITKQWNEFSALLDGDCPEDKITATIKSSIIINKDSVFGYKIDTSKVEDILALSFKNVCGLVEDDWLKKIEQDNILYLTLSTASPDLESLKNMLGLKSTEKEFFLLGKEGKRMVYYGKKDVASRSIIVSLLLAVIIIILIIFLFLLMI